MTTRCFSHHEDNINTLSEKWQKVSYSIEEDLRTVDEILQKKEYSNLDTSLTRLKKNLEEVKKIYKKVKGEIHSRKEKEESAIICGIPSTKFKALLCAGVGGVAWILVTTSSGLDQIKDLVSFTEIKWTNIAVCIAGAAVSKFGDVLWNRWGNEEATKSKLHEIKSKASLIPQTETTIEILSSLYQMSLDKNKETQELASTFEKISKLASPKPKPRDIPSLKLVIGTLKQLKLKNNRPPISPSLVRNDFSSFLLHQLKDERRQSLEQQVEAEQTLLIEHSEKKAEVTKVKVIYKNDAYDYPLYIRGIGSNLKGWNKGISLSKIDEKTYIYPFTGAIKEVQYKILLNNTLWEEGPNHCISEKEKEQILEISPYFNFSQFDASAKAHENETVIEINEKD